MKRIKKVKIKKRRTIMPWIIFSVFVSMNIFFTIITATSGAQYKDLEQEKNDLVDENQTLDSEIISLNSLKNLEDEAYKTGFVKPSKVLYVTYDETVAKAQ